MFCKSIDAAKLNEFAPPRQLHGYAVFISKGIMNKRLSTLMQGLYYPAVLGTALVLLIAKFTVYRSFTNAATDISLYFGFLILVYFSVSFLVNEALREKYGCLAFLSDIAEIILIFLMFYFLGFLDPSDPNKIHFRRFYFVLAVIPLLQQFWNYAAGASKYFPKLSIAAATILLFGGFCGFHYVGFNIAMIFVIAALIGAYFYELMNG